MVGVGALRAERSNSRISNLLDLLVVIRLYLVQIRLALFAEVIFRALVFIHDAYASTMLPDFALVALYEQSSCVFVQRVRESRYDGFYCDRRAWVVLVTADTTRHVIFSVGRLFFNDLLYLRRLIVLGIVSTLASAGLWRFAGMVL